MKVSAPEYGDSRNGQRLTLLLLVSGCTLQDGGIPGGSEPIAPHPMVREAARSVDLDDLDLLACAGRPVEHALTVGNGTLRQQFSKCDFRLPDDGNDGCLARCRPSRR